MSFARSSSGRASGGLYPWNLYDEDEPFAIMAHIIDLFVQTAESRGSSPVVILLPHRNDVIEQMRYNEGRAARLVEYMESKRYMHIDVIRKAAELKPADAELDAWFQGHATAEGNMTVARLIEDDLRRLFIFENEAPERNRTP
jgi:hypothetical protein